MLVKQCTLKLMYKAGKKKVEELIDGGARWVRSPRATTVKRFASR